MEEQIFDTRPDDVDEKPLSNGVTLFNGKYRIEKKLAQGTFGITYLAETRMQGNLGNIATKVAIKEFFLKGSNTRSGNSTSVTGSQGQEFLDYKRKFIIEAKNLAKMSQYDDIVNVYDVFEENNTAYFAMEFIDGGNLDEYILQNGNIPESQAIGYIKSIAGALKHLHDNNMVHLDMKPKNIMRRKDGKLYLIDFGLAKQYDANGEPESSTKIGLGTPGYAPIEQADFKGGFAPTLDIYALGATFYKMLTGVTPPNSSDIFNYKDGFEPLARKLRQRSVSESTIAIVSKAMELKKFNRFQTVSEFLSALEQPGYRNTSSSNDDTTIRSDMFVETNVSNDAEDQKTLEKLLRSLIANEEYKDAYNLCLDYIDSGKCKDYALTRSSEIAVLVKKQNNRKSAKQMILVIIVLIIATILSVVFSINR